MRDRDVPADGAVLGRERERTALELKSWTSGRAATDLDLVPPDTRRAVERLGEGLLRSEATGERGGDVTPFEVGALAVAADAGKEAVAVALKRTAHAVDAADVDADSHHHVAREATTNGRPEE